MTHFSFKLFGAFQASLNGQSVTKFPTDKVQALLIYLLMHADQPLRRDTLIGLFWAEQPDQDARRNLRQSLFRLRRTFDTIEPQSSDQLLTTTRQTVTLHSAVVESDVQTMARVQKKLDDHGVAQVAQAVELYRGEFLAGFSLVDALVFEEWMLVQREGWLQEVLQLLHTLILYHQQRGDFAQVALYAARQIELEPLRESAYRHLILASAKQGQRNKALAYYEACRDLFDQELDVEPTAETTQLYEQIKAEAFPAQSQAGGHLPHLSTPLIGRDADITAVISHLKQPTCRILTLLGEGGIGKTSLATAVSHQPELDTIFPDGRYFIQLAGLSSAESIIPAIGRGIGLAFTEQLLGKDQLWDYCRNKKALLVLDNFEHLMVGAELLADLTAVAPQITLLVTSRESLNLRAEQRYPIAGLSFPTHIEQGKLANFDAIDLFIEAAQRVEPAFALSEDNQTAVYDICQLVHGSPLAIEFAAAWVRLMDCTQIAEEIRQNIAFLASSHRDTSTRHQSMLAVFDQSWRLLTPQEQQALAFLSHFRGSFSLDAILQITAVAMIDLAGLLDKSLVRRDENGRYALHELLRQYAAQKADPTAKATQALVHKHSHFYLTLIAKQGNKLFGVQSSELMGNLKPELDNIRWAWQNATNNHLWPLLETSIDGLSNYYFMTGYLPEFASLLKLTLAVLETAVSLPLKATILEKLATIYIRQGQFDTAKTTAQTLSYLGHQTNQPDFDIRASICLGWLKQYHGDYEGALSAFDNAVNYYNQSDDQERLAQLYNRIGHIYYLQGKSDTALTYLQQGLEISQTLENEVQKAEILNDMGHAFTAIGENGRGLAHYQQALDINQRLNLKKGISSVLHNLGRVYSRQNDDQKALDYYQQALAINDQLGVRQDIAITLNSIGIIYKRQEKYDDALIYYQQALAINRELGVKAEISNNLSNIGNIYKHNKNHETAETHLLEALQLAKEAKYPEGIIGSWGNLALLYVEWNALDKAQTAFAQAISLAREVNAKFVLAVLLINNASLLQTLNQLLKAKEFVTEGIQLAKLLENTSLIEEGTELLESLP